MLRFSPLLLALDANHSPLDCQTLYTSAPSTSSFSLLQDLFLQAVLSLAPISDCTVNRKQSHNVYFNIYYIDIFQHFSLSTLSF